MHWFSRVMELPQGTGRWVIVRTHASQQRAQLSVQRQVSKVQIRREQKCWHSGNRRFACEADARAALGRELKGKPTWLAVEGEFVAHPQYAGKGRPRKDASPATQRWQIVATVAVNQEQVDEEAFHKACWIIGTNVLDPTVFSDHQLVTTYKEQGGVERGFRFLRISALSGFLRLCQETGADHGTQFHHGAVLTDLSFIRISIAVPPGRDAADHSRSSAQVHGTFHYAALVFQCFEGIELLHVHTSTTSLVLVLRLQPVHQLI